jgi:hypothetical protein
VAFRNRTYVTLELPPGDTLVSFENRQTDNLPEHLLGEAFWQDHERSKEASYRIHTASQGDLSLEFINNSWFLIWWNETLDTVMIPRIRADRPDRPGRMTQMKTRSMARIAI